MEHESRNKQVKKNYYVKNAQTDENDIWKK